MSKSVMHKQLSAIAAEADTGKPVGLAISEKTKKAHAHAIQVALDAIGWNRELPEDFGDRHGVELTYFDGVLFDADGWKIEQARRAHLPARHHHAPAMRPEGTDIVAWIFPGEPGQAYTTERYLFQGRSAKPRLSGITRDEAWARESIGEIVERRRTMKAPHDLKVGDILVAAWGYEQTNIDFYEVREVSGAMVVYAAIELRLVAGWGEVRELVAPVPGSFQPEDKRRGRPRGDGSIKLTSYSAARKWGGKPCSRTGWAYGH